MYANNDEKIIYALRFCVSNDGEYCDLCPYQNVGTNCSRRLLRDASNRLRELTIERKEEE